jgi:glycine cleavage system transcriptional repressor
MPRFDRPPARGVQRPYARHMRRFALSSIGRDRPGIVAGLTQALLEHGVNIEDSQMTILRGQFAVMLVLAAPEDLAPDVLEGDLEGAAEALGLAAITLSELDDAAERREEPSHIVTVYGVDHPGIVHAVARAISDQGVNITDLNTRLVAEPGNEPLYAMMLEVALPPDGNPDELDAVLAGVGESEGVEVSVRELEQDTL